MNRVLLVDLCIVLFGTQVQDYQSLDFLKGGQKALIICILLGTVKYLKKMKYLRHCFNASFAPGMTDLQTKF